MDETSSDSSAERFLSMVSEKYDEKEGGMDSSSIIYIPGDILKEIEKSENPKIRKNSKCTSVGFHPDVDSSLLSQNCKKECKSNSVAAQLKIYNETEIPFERQNLPCKKKFKAKRKKIENKHQRLHDGRVQIDCPCNKENLDRLVPNCNPQCVINNNCDNLMRNLSINVITKVGGSGARQDELLQDSEVVENKSETGQPSLPGLTADQRQRIQDFIDSIKPEYCTPFCNNCSNPDVDGYVTSTPKVAMTSGLNTEQFRTSPLQIGFVTTNSFSSTSSRYPNRGTDTAGNKSVVNTPSNSSGEQNEEAIMGYVDRLIASEEHDIQQEVEERFGRMLQNQRSARDSLTSAVNATDNVFDEEMVVDSSVEIVSVTPGSRQIFNFMNTVDTSDEVVVLSNNDSDVEIFEGPCTSAGVRNNRRRKCDSPKQPFKKRRKYTSTNENKVPSNDANGTRSIANPTASQNSALGTRECPICFDQLQSKEISSTTCGHVFCTTCIKAAIKSSRTCPNCRTKLTLKKIHPLFL